MKSFGVHVRIDRPDLFPSLQNLVQLLKIAKESDEFGSLGDWHNRLPDEVSAKFEWLDGQELEDSQLARKSQVVRIAQPDEAMGGVWSFDAILDAVQNGEYALLNVERSSPDSAEIRIEPEAYPYGGIGAFIAIAEAHGMYVLGVNEYGKYQTRAEFAGPSISPQPPKPWWKLW